MNDIPVSSAVRTLDDVLALTAEERAAVDALIRRRLCSDVALVNQVGEYIIQAGGKRLRPMAHLLAARAAGYEGEAHIQMAAIIEFIHTATLLHDDVVDESELRRGRETAHTVWGNAASVLVGDYLYSRSFQLMVELDRMPVMRILADTTNRIAAGEVLQLMHLGNPDLTVQAYMEVIEAKTACLFAAACRLGAVLADGGETLENRLHDYGMQVGLAFQITDDLLDYRGNPETLGKNMGDDLAEGKVTLPLILAMAAAGRDDRLFLEDIISTGGSEDLPRVRRILDATGALDTAERHATALARAAGACLDALPASPAGAALRALARYSVLRIA